MEEGNELLVCDFCKKRMEDPRVVHTASGKFHPECCDRLHAATEAIGKIMFSFLHKDAGARVKALESGAKPLADYLKQLSENIRARER